MTVKTKSTSGIRPDLTLSTDIEVVGKSTWAEAEADHHRQVDDLTSAYRSRIAESRSHPVEDFLFTYYSFRPSQLRRWHPGAGVALQDAADRSEWRFHRMIRTPGSTVPAVVADITEFRAARGKSLSFIRDLLASTAATPGQFGCFGLHEWAMVFQEEEHRHLGWPLRLGQSGTDDVVRDHQIRCSHYDAFRFFTPGARGRNLLTPDLMSRDRMEQPGCLHASMDLYKWAYRLVPVISSGLLLECFRLARAIREVDMRASPYDLTALGYEPIRIETTEGKSQYVAAQRDFAQRGQLLRARLSGALDHAYPDGE